MSEWIAEVDRLDKILHAEGVPPNIRIRAVAQIADVLAQADKAKRERESFLAECRQAASLHRAVGAQAAAGELGIPVRTLYWRRDWWLAHCATPPLTELQAQG